MQRKSVVIGLALSLGLALGLVLSPAITGRASAQTQGQPSSTMSIFLDKLASTLGIQRTALDTAITTAANGTVDQELQQGTVTQEQATKLKERIAQGQFFGAFGGGRRGGDGRGDVAGVRQAMYDAAAAKLGITADAFKTELRNGTTLAAIAQAHNTTELAVIDAALAAAKTKLDAAVTAGTLTREKADVAYARLQQAGAKIFEGGPGGHGGKPGDRGTRPNRGGTQTPIPTPAA